jgi:hypothetical protein
VSWLRLEEITCRAQRAAAASLREPGAVVLTPQIGPGMDRLLRLSLSDARPIPRLGPGADIALVETRALRPVARGTTLPDAAQGGIVTRRWFILPVADAPELVRLSTTAWDGFEGDTAGRPFGLWQEHVARADGLAHVMLLTHYPSLTAWDESRYWKPGPEAQKRREEWGALFARRRALLRDTWVEVWGVAA